MRFINVFYYREKQFMVILETFDPLTSYIIWIWFNCPIKYSKNKCIRIKFLLLFNIVNSRRHSIFIFNFFHQLVHFLSERTLLPASHRQKVDNNGTLAISSISRDLDQGSYSCSAKGRQGNTDTQEMFLQVVGKSFIN